MKVEETPGHFLVGREVPSLKWREELGSGCESDIGGEGGGRLGHLDVTGGGDRGEEGGKNRRVQGWNTCGWREGCPHSCPHVHRLQEVFAHSSLPLFK